MKDIGDSGGGKMNKTKSFLACKSLNCLFDDLWKNGITNFCELQNNFETDNKIIDLVVGGAIWEKEKAVAKKKEPNGTLYGFTNFNSETGKITIVFNPDFCTNSFKKFDIGDKYDAFYDFLAASKTIIHESIHADFIREILSLIPKGLEISKDNFEQTFREFIDIICSDGDNLSDQHEAMVRTANNWIDRIAKDLFELNNNVGKWEDYRYQAWRGIWKDGNECINSTFLNKAEFIDLRNDYLNNILINSITHTNIDNMNNCVNE